ncbi:MAG: hypothetical protein GOP50_12385 [Candidatus Heimdallarchaeota archaeon]|nr:hypothetical protein [Candidatus Heimdallarchaeota archaeon]
MSREDHITHEPEPFMIIEDKKQLKAYNDPKLVILLDLLRKGHMPIRDITFEYNKRISKAKSEITIYNYLKSLQDVDLVMVSGQRLVRGSSATTQLYSRKAQLMFPMTLMTDKYWETENSKELIEATRELMSFHTNGSPAESNDLKALLKNLYSVPSVKLKDYVTKYSDSLKTIFSDSSQEEVRDVINLFSLVMILLEPEKYAKDLKKCFP